MGGAEGGFRGAVWGGAGGLGKGRGGNEVGRKTKIDVLGSCLQPALTTSMPESRQFQVASTLPGIKTN